MKGTKKEEVTEEVMREETESIAEETAEVMTESMAEEAADEPADEPDETEAVSEPDETEAVSAEEPIMAQDDDDTEFELPKQETEEESGEEETEDAPEGTEENGESGERRDRIQVASKRQKRKIYRTETVFTENGHVRVTRQESERHKEYVELAGSVKEHNVLRGRLIGYTCVLRDGSASPVPLGEVEYKKHWTVYIPADVLFDQTIQPPEILTSLRDPDNQYGAYKDVLNRRINSVVDFVATYVDEKGGYALGSHIWAMNKRSQEHYARLQRDGHPNITTGCIARGSIVQVNSFGVYVDLYGAECFIPNNELTWFQIADAREHYDVGGDIDVRILSIEKKNLYDAHRKKEYSVAKVSASAKQTSSDPNKRYFNEIEVGSTGLGVVTQVTEFGVFAIFKNKVQVKCGLVNSGNGVQPMIGDEVRIEIKKKGINPKDGKFLYGGKIKHWISHKEF